MIKHLLYLMVFLAGSTTGLHAMSDEIKSDIHARVELLPHDLEYLDEQGIEGLGANSSLSERWQATIDDYNNPAIPPKEFFAYHLELVQKGYDDEKRARIYSLIRKHLPLLKNNPALRKSMPAKFLTILYKSFKKVMPPEVPAPSSSSFIKKAWLIKGAGIVIVTSIIAFFGYRYFTKDKRSSHARKSS